MGLRIAVTGGLALLLLTGCGSGGELGTVGGNGSNSAGQGASPDFYETVGNAALRIEPGAGLLLNDAPGSAVVDEVVTSLRGATVDLDPDGSFVYEPPPASEVAKVTPGVPLEDGATQDTFSYRLRTGQTATVTIDIPYKVIFVKSDGPINGDGSQARPVRTVADALARVKKNDIIYLFFSNGTPFNFSGTIPVSVKLLGHGVTLREGGVTVPADAHPRLLGTLNLAGNNEVAGLQLENATGPVLQSRSTNGLTVRGNIFRDTPSAVSFQDPTDVDIIGNRFLLVDSRQPENGDAAVNITATRTCSVNFNFNSLENEGRTFAHGLVIKAKGRLDLQVTAQRNVTTCSLSHFNLEIENGTKLVADITQNRMKGANVGVTLFDHNTGPEVGRTTFTIDRNTYEGFNFVQLLARDLAGPPHIWKITNNRANNVGSALDLSSRPPMRLQAQVTNNTFSTAGYEEWGVLMESYAAEQHLVFTGNNITASAADRGSMSLRLGAETMSLALEQNTAVGDVVIQMNHSGAAELAMRNNAVQGALAVIARGPSLELDVSGQVTPVPTFR